jgi:hypothetical protein
MSLETKIQELTIAIEKLTVIMSNANTTTTEPSKAKSEVKTEEPKNVTPVVAGMTREQLKEGCLNLVREDASNKVKIRNLLAEFNAKVIDDVPNDELAEFEAELAKL